MGKVMVVPNAQYTYTSDLHDVCEYRDREVTESGGEYLQVIPYVMLRGVDGWSAYVRTSGDIRLQGQMSIGYGGHVEDGESIMEALYREVEEETGLIRGTYSKPKCLGVIQDTETEVSRAHIGVCFYSEVYVKIDNPVKLSCLRGLEIWSQIALDLYTDVACRGLRPETLLQACMDVGRLAMMRSRDGDNDNISEYQKKTLEAMLGGTLLSNGWFTGGVVCDGIMYDNNLMAAWPYWMPHHNRREMVTYANKYFYNAL